MYIVIAILTVIINLILQSTIIQDLSINHVSFNLFIITVCSVALLRGQRDGMIVGYAIGFMQDLFFGQVLGLYAILYMTAGFTVGFFSKIFYKESVFIPVMAIGAADFILNILIYVFSMLFRGRTEFSYYLVNIILPEVSYTAVVSIFIYRIFLYTDKILERYDRWKVTREKL